MKGERQQRQTINKVRNVRGNRHYTSCRKTSILNTALLCGRGILYRHTRERSHRVSLRRGILAGPLTSRTALGTGESWGPLPCWCMDAEIGITRGQSRWEFLRMLVPLCGGRGRSRRSPEGSRSTMDLKDVGSELGKDANCPKKLRLVTQAASSFYGLGRVASVVTVRWF